MYTMYPCPLCCASGWGSHRRRITTAAGFALFFALALSGCRSVVGIEERPGASADAATDTESGEDASVDAVVDRTVPAEAGVEAGCDADADVDPCALCEAGPEASPWDETCGQVGVAQVFHGGGTPHIEPFGGVRLAKSSSHWGMAWPAAVMTGVAYVSVNETMDAFIPDVLPVSLPSGGEVWEVALAAGDDRMLLGVSRWMADLSHGADFYALQPSSGDVIEGPVTLTAAGPGLPVEVVSIAAAPGKNRFVAVTRDTGVDFSGLLRAHLFQTQPLQHLHHVDLGTGDQIRVAWSETAQRFGVAYVVEQGVPTGMLALFDSELSMLGHSEFTGAHHEPFVRAAPYELSIAAAGKDFLLTWMDAFDAPDEPDVENYLDVYVTSASALTGEVNVPGGVKVSGDDDKRRTYASVVHDGTSAVVSWLEKDGPNQTLEVRRFDVELEEVGEPVFAFEQGELLIGPAGSAAAGKNDYGFAGVVGNGAVRLVRIGCSTP